MNARRPDEGGRRLRHPLDEPHGRRHVRRRRRSARWSPAIGRSSSTSSLPQVPAGRRERLADGLGRRRRRRGRRRRARASRRRSSPRSTPACASARWSRSSAPRGLGPHRRPRRRAEAQRVEDEQAARAEAPRWPRPRSAAPARPARPDAARPAPRLASAAPDAGPRPRRRRPDARAAGARRVLLAGPPAALGRPSSTRSAGRPRAAPAGARGHQGVRPAAEARRLRRQGPARLLRRPTATGEPVEVHLHLSGEHDRHDPPRARARSSTARAGRVARRRHSEDYLVYRVLDALTDSFWPSSSSARPSASTSWRRRSSSTAQRHGRGATSSACAASSSELQPARCSPQRDLLAIGRATLLERCPGLEGDGRATTFRDVHDHLLQHRRRARATCATCSRRCRHLPLDATPTASTRWPRA